MLDTWLPASIAAPTAAALTTTHFAASRIRSLARCRASTFGPPAPAPSPDIAVRVDAGLWTYDRWQMHIGNLGWVDADRDFVEHSRTACDRTRQLCLPRIQRQPHPMRHCVAS